MASDLLSWPQIGPNQRLYVCRPDNRDWRGGFDDYYHPKLGGQGKPVWDFSGDDFKPGHLVLTYMQTNPMMIVGVETPRGLRRKDGSYCWDGVLHFRHGLILEEVERVAGIGLSTLNGYLEAADAREVIRAMKKVYEADQGLFGERW